MAGSYTTDFYDRIGEGSLESARVVVPLIQAMFNATSVIDFGCGTGSWLKAFEENGASDVQGLDFGEVAPEQLQIAPERFATMDLSERVDLGRRFDLAISLEVAEHLSEDAANQFVGNLVRHADIVVFSAAIPGQLGNGHINCQYPSYWAEIFSHHMYRCYDALRADIWERDEIPFWYRQNMVVFARRKVSDHFPQTARDPDTWIDLVHPDMLADRLSQDQARRAALHDTYKERIKEAKAEVWSKVRAQSETPS